MNKSVNKKDSNSFDTLNLSINSLSRDKLWKNKVKEEVINNDSLYVKTLTQWDKVFYKNNTIIQQQTNVKTANKNKIK